MLQVFISSKFQQEKEYIISVMLKDFLGLEYELTIDESEPNYLIKHQEKQLIIEDHFFSKIEASNYLLEKYLPKNLVYTDKKTPILYGDDIINITDGSIEMSSDIFASSFFMLTRWEEFITDKKDHHNRFKTSESIAYKYNFHRKPIVNEYLEILWQNLLLIGVSESLRKKRTYTLQFSHDVDHPLLFANFSGFIRQSGYQLLKKRNVSQTFKFIHQYFSSKNDSYNTFDKLMENSEKKNIISQFNFMNASKGKFEEGYSIHSSFIQSLISKIKHRGHNIGFHPSYETYNDGILWEKEKQGLENIADQEIIIGRQHYLRFENPITWNIWEENDMKEDSTLGYADEVGFRCGTCYSYHPFDIIKRKKMKILETPLIFMEGAAIHSLSLSPEDFFSVSNQLKEEVKKYDGIYTVLWHNSSFFLEPYPQYEHLLSEI